MTRQREGKRDGRRVGGVCAGFSERVFFNLILIKDKTDEKKRFDARSDTKKQKKK